MERKVVKIMTKTTVKLIFAITVVLTLTSALTGCIEANGDAEFTVRRLFAIPEGLTETQTRWILAGETILIVFLVLLIILLITLFNRYRKTEKRALEASIRARALVRENEVLDRLNRTKTEFFQNMSHDFKTPLTVISTSVLNAVDLLDYEMDKEEIRESLSLAQSEIMRLSRIVDGALKHAAMHSNRQVAEAIDIAQMLRKISKTYRAFLNRHGNILTTSVPNTLPRVYGNADMLLNVFSNLIANANRFTRNGEINIAAEVIRQGVIESSDFNFVSFKVSDNGSGVNPDVLENIFARGASDSGTGLGLSICKTAIETYGGTISVESEEGKGTRVTFTMPIYDDKITETEGIEEAKRRV